MSRLPARDPECFGPNLRRILKSLEMTQTELAERTGLTSANVSQLINGKRKVSLSTLCKILDAIPTNFEALTRKS